MSVAGKRAGLDGARSGLFMEQIRIVKEMRAADEARQLRSGRADVNIRPRFMVWENVPGVFSSNGGEDFRAVLEEVVRVKDQNAVIPRPTDGKWTPSGCILGDGYSVAWRVHDAQFWGVPQRRKRIALVADFSGGGAPEILFECKGLPGDIAAGGEAREETAGDIRTDASETISFQERAGCEGGAKESSYRENGRGPCQPLTNKPCSNKISCFGISPFHSKGMESDNPNAGIYKADTSRTLDLNGGSPACNQGGMAIVEEKATPYQKTTGPLMASGYQKNGTQEAMNDMYVVATAYDGSQISPTLTANNAGGSQRMPDKANFNAVITYGIDRASFNQGQNAQYDFAVEEELAPTVLAKGPGGVLAQQ